MFDSSLRHAFMSFRRLFLGFKCRYVVSIYRFECCFVGSRFNRRFVLFRRFAFRFRRFVVSSHILNRVELDVSEFLEVVRSIS